MNRRRLLQSLALAGGQSASAQPALEVNVLGNVAAAHGANLSDARLRVLKPVLDRRLAQLRALRDFEFDDGVEPTQGILGR